MAGSICDTHCDTISRILDKNQELYSNDGHLDVMRLVQQNYCMQFFAAWIAPEYKNNGFLRASNIVKKFRAEYEKNTNYLRIVKTSEDIDLAISDKKIAALIAIEGGEALDGDISNLHKLYDMGVRCMTLTWNGRNEIADGVGVQDAGGITEFGTLVIREMNRIGMIVDVSHLSEKGFWEVVDCTDQPFIATHSNAYSICGHKRNLKDEQIREIIRRKGFIGINFYPDFLSEDNPCIDTIITHIDYLLQLGAQDIIGFGADFDGVDNLPSGIKGTENMGNLIEKMFKLGYSESIVENISYKNAVRATKEILNLSNI